MSFMRSYRIRCIVMVQYLGQIYSVYGQHDSKAFLNAKAKVVFALNDLDDAKYISSCLGNRTVKVESTTGSSGRDDSFGHFSRSTHTLSGATINDSRSDFEVKEIKNDCIIGRKSSGVVKINNYFF